MSGFAMLESVCEGHSMRVLTHALLVIATSGLAILSAHAAPMDFDGDGKSDILWRNPATGADWVYFMDGKALRYEGFMPTVPDASWKIVGVGDFSGDGRSDILWRNSSSGENYVWLMNGVAIVGQGYLRTVDLNWRVAGVGDFSGDAKADILWRNTATGENYIQCLDGTSIAWEGYIRSVPLGWSIAGLGDFNGDGAADILWRNIATGENYLYPMNGIDILATEGYIRSVPGPNWQVGAVADFNGDGRADILWRNVSTGENYLYPMNGRTVLGGEGYVRSVTDLSWQIAATADYDGDGKADLLWRNASTGANYLYPMDGTTIKPTEGNLPTVALAWGVTAAAPDTVTPSTPAGLTATAVSSSRINLSWSASMDNVAVTGYRVFRNGALLQTLGNVTTYANTGLAASTTYSYAVRALDAADNVSELSSSASATTQASADTVAPSTPTGLVATAVSSSQINLSWTASTDNVGVTGYRIFRDGALIQTVGNVTTYANTGLTASTTYSYAVRALDAAGNVSGLSSSASATTQSGGGTPGTPSISNVSGAISHGSSVTISGSSFGTKSHAGPMLWDDFDSGTNGSAVAGPSGGTQPLIHQGNLAGYSQWERGGGGAISNLSILFNSAAPKASSARHARATFSNSSYWGLDLYVPYSQFTTGNELYISFYYRFTKTSANFGRQTKAWIAYPSSGPDKAYWTNSFGTCQAGDYWRTHATELVDENSLNPGLGATEINGEWVRFESYLKQSGPGVANGAWHQAAYRPSLATPEKHSVTLNNYRMRNTSENWVDWTFGGAYYDMCGSADTATIDVDDFYMDRTRARVEVCNTPTWSARTKCELQLPTAWSDTSITATFKKGYLPSSTTAYVYVINAAGSVNAAGYPVTVGP
jgi:chitodextrinase